MDSRAGDHVEAPSPERVVERATLARRAIARLAVTNRDRFAAIDRRLMPDRLRVPPEIVELLSLEPAR